jgi:hypothetical protein
MALREKRTLELREVEAARRRVSRSLRSTGVDISVRNSTALADARWKASAMVVGWIPWVRRRGWVIETRTVSAGWRGKRERQTEGRGTRVERTRLAFLLRRRTSAPPPSRASS